MQTFLPLPDFRASLETLDPRRLGNQVYREGLTLLRGGWQRHPAARMWAQHRGALALYTRTGLVVLASRGLHYPHHVAEAEAAMLRYGTELPPWFGDDKLHASHRSNLLRKDPTWYRRFGWTEPDNLPYYWPAP